MPFLMSSATASTQSAACALYSACWMNTARGLMVSTGVILIYRFILLVVLMLMLLESSATSLVHGVVELVSACWPRVAFHAYVFDQTIT